MLLLILTFAVTLLAAIFAVGCKQEHTPVRQVAPISLELLANDAQRYNHQIVTVYGCYVRGFERSALVPCEGQKDDKMVWVESADDIVETANHIKEESVPEPKALQTPPRTNFVFQYDEAKSRAAWQKLRSASSRHLEVTLVGQFDAGASGVLVSLPSDDRRLILIDTLTVKPL